jgi:hypothetical protein
MNDIDLFFLPSFIFGVAVMMYALWCDREHIFKASDESFEATVPLRQTATIHMHTSVQRSRKNVA